MSRDVSFISKENLFLKATFLVHTVGFFITSDFVMPNEFNVFPFWTFLEHEPNNSFLKIFNLQIHVFPHIGMLSESWDAKNTLLRGSWRPR